MLKVTSIWVKSELLPSASVKNELVDVRETPLDISYHPSHQTLQGRDLHHLRLLEIESVRLGPSVLACARR